MTDESEPQSGPPENVAVNDILDQLRELEGTITTAEQHEELQETRRMLERLPGGEEIEGHISKYTTRDIGEAFVGSIIFALPLLVEDGVFIIADHFLEVLVAGIPVFLAANVVFVTALTAGLIYAVDVREVRINNPILGVIPRRLVGVLAVSFLTAAGLMILWGRMFIDDPSTVSALSRITVVWAAAALGASLGDILPGESKGTDLTIDNIDDLVGDGTE
ncbi:MAG: DUF2391 domain-containing protein [Halovenus sp.]